MNSINLFNGKTWNISQVKSDSVISSGIVTFYLSITHFFFLNNTRKQIFKINSCKLPFLKIKLVQTVSLYLKKRKEKRVTSKRIFLLIQLSIFSNISIGGAITPAGVSS